MDYLSQLQNFGGLASSYQSDLARRAADINVDQQALGNFNQLENQYTNAMGNWENSVEAIKNQGINEVKSWGIESGSEIGVDLLAHAYVGSAVQAAVNAGISSAKATIGESISTAKGALSDAVSSLQGKVSGLVDTATETASDAVQSGISMLQQKVLGIAPKPAAAEEIELSELAPTQTTAITSEADIGARGALSSEEVGALTYPSLNTPSEVVGNTSEITSVGATQQADIASNTAAENTFSAEMTDYKAGDYAGAAELEGEAAPAEAEAGGEDVAKDIGEDAVEDTALDATGVGEILMAGQIVYGLGKSLFDLFDPPKKPPPPPPPTAPSLIAIPNLPTFIQSSAQSGV